MRRVYGVLMCAGLVAPVLSQPTENQEQRVERAQDAPAREFRLEGGIWSFRVPAGWVQADKDALEFMQREIGGLLGTNPGNVVAGFFPEGGSLFQYPYVIVLEIRQDFTRASWEDIERAFGAKTVADAKEKVEKAIPGMTTGFAAPVVDRKDGTLTCDSTVSLPDGTTVVGRSVGYFAKDRLVQVNAYALQEDVQKDMPAMAGFFESFALDKGTKANPRPAWTRGAAAAGLLGAAVAGLVGAVAGMRKRQKKAAGGAQ